VQHLFRIIELDGSMRTGALVLGLEIPEEDIFVPEVHSRSPLVPLPEEDLPGFLALIDGGEFGAVVARFEEPEAWGEEPLFPYAALEYEEYFISNRENFK
jgi:hypothetical protein